LLTCNVDLSKDYEALGGAYNAFSLNESGGSLPLAIERVGQACDGTYLSLQELVPPPDASLIREDWRAQVQGLSSSFSEPLAESSQFAVILRQVLKYRRQKALQLELSRDTLQNKSAQLSTLEKSELEARRIEGVLARIEGSQVLPRQNPSSPPPTTSVSSLPPDDPSSLPEPERDDEEEEATSPTKAKPRKRLSGVGKVFGFGKLNYAMKGIIDVDPETTRRNNIGKTKESIAQVPSPSPRLFYRGLIIVGIIVASTWNGC
jgi:sorting nexin-41/42